VCRSPSVSSFALLAIYIIHMNVCVSPCHTCIISVLFLDMKDDTYPRVCPLVEFMFFLDMKDETYPRVGPLVV
jgi:hypothetical protein